MDRQKYPVFLDFELSNKCNLSCVMCTSEFSSAIAGQSNDYYDEGFLVEIQEFLPHAKCSAFKGGEPLLVDIYYKIWSKIVDVNPLMEISIVTNGNVLPERFKELLDKGNFAMRVSIDSLQKENYAKIRKNGDLDKVLQNIAYYAEKAKVLGRKLAIMVCPMTINWEELPAFVPFCNKLNAELFFATLIYPKEVSLKYLPAEKLWSIIDRFNKMVFLKDSELAIYNEKVFQEMVQQLMVWAKDAKDVDRYTE